MAMDRVKLITAAFAALYADNPRSPCKPDDEAEIGDAAEHGKACMIVQDIDPSVHVHCGLHQLLHLDAVGNISLNE
jgi:hypothetical protein